MVNCSYCKNEVTTIIGLETLRCEKCRIDCNNTADIAAFGGDIKKKMKILNWPVVDKLQQVDTNYLTYLEESYNKLNDKYDRLTNEMRIITDENLQNKQDMRILKKELEIVKNENNLRNTNFNILIDKLGEEGQRLSILAKSLSINNNWATPTADYTELLEGNENIKNALVNFKCRYIWYGLVALLLIIGITTTLLIIYPPFNSNLEDEIQLSSNYSDRFVPRGLWFALSTRGKVDEFKEKPLKYVMIGHTASSKCVVTAACESLVRTLQADAFSRGWSDIGYNFLLGGSGYIYEGRGWDKIAAHTALYNNISLGVAFMGNFALELPPKKQLKALKILLAEGVELGKLTPDYKMILQKQVKSTESPGAALISELTTWDHWSPDVPKLSTK